MKSQFNKDPQTYAIIGAAMAVHRELGHGFLESVYHEALKLEFKDRHIPFVSQKELPVLYKGSKLNSVYKTDFLCFESIILEIKALKSLTSLEESQVINYLKASNLNRGLLINFGSRQLEYKRLVFNLR